MRDVAKTALEHEYLGLRVLETEQDEVSGVASVRFQTLMREIDASDSLGDYIATEEVSQFIVPKGSYSGGWLYVDGDVSDPSDEDYEKLVDLFSADEEDEGEGEGEGEGGSDTGNTSEQIAQKLTPQALSAWRAMKESQQPVQRDRKGQRRKSSARGRDAK